MIKKYHCLLPLAFFGGLSLVPNPSGTKESVPKEERQWSRGGRWSAELGLFVSLRTNKRAKQLWGNRGTSCLRSSADTSPGPPLDIF